MKSVFWFLFFLCSFAAFSYADRVHTVRRGENLSLIASRYNITVGQLRQLNNLRSTVIQPGQRLIVSRSSPSQSSPWGYDTVNYTVRGGDSLWTISRRFDVSIAQIKRTNNMNSDRLAVGQRLKIDVPRKLPNIDNLESIIGSSEKTHYRVKAGDTVESVAGAFNIEPDKLLETNLLERKDFKEGQILVIPSENFLYETYEDEIITKELSSRDKVVKKAYGYLNMPYKLGGSGKQAIDCSTLTRLAYENLGINLPNTVYPQFQQGVKVERDIALPGDLVFFRIDGRISHVGMYLGDDLFIHASTTQGKVAISSLNNSYFRRHFAGLRRYLPETENLYTTRFHDVLNR